MRPPANALGGLGQTLRVHDIVRGIDNVLREENTSRELVASRNAMAASAVLSPTG
jgi:hypothetical protein